MLRRKGTLESGFTLIELVIVLGVAGLMFGGLWKLQSAGMLQSRDQATASQQAQLIAAVSTYLQSSGDVTSTTGGGQGFLKAINGAAAAPNNSATLYLPAAGCTGTAATSNPGLCNFLPTGFYSTSMNPYGQTYSIRVLKDGTGTNVAPQSYSFLILTTGGDTIPDTSGGRISGMIGGDGGFIYSSDATTAVGAFGAWTAVPSSVYGISGTTGHVASRTYYSPLQNISDLWLARKPVAGDTASYIYNTMTTPLYLGNQITYFGSSSTAAATASTGIMYMQGGTIVLSDSTNVTTGGTINLGTITFSNGTSYISEVTGGSTTTNPGIELAANMAGGNPAVKLDSSCIKASFSDGSCNFIMSINGSETVRDLLYAGMLYSGQFIYQTSDVRLKKDIKALVDPLSDIMKLKPVSFAYKSNGKESLGVIAQDLEQVYPQLVTDGPTGMKAVSYEGLIAPLVGAVQELKKENDELRTQLRDQAARQEQLGQKITTLRSK